MAQWPFSPLEVFAGLFMTDSFITYEYVYKNSFYGGNGKWNSLTIPL